MHPVVKDLGLSDPAPGVICGDGNNAAATSGKLLESRNPATGEVLGSVRQATRAHYDERILRSQAGFEKICTA